MVQIVQGRVNKQIARDIGVTETTVKVHRCNMMRKMNAASLLDLREMAEKLRLLRRTLQSS
jgi:FixJ family two-component response regulator